MSYYSNAGTSTTFYSFIKMKDSKDQPLDTVQVIINDPYRTAEHNFLTGGWDGVLRYYRIPPKNTEEIESIYTRFLQHPILSLAYGKDTFVFAGLSTGDIAAVDIANNQSTVIGSHNAPILKLFWVDKFNLLMSFGYDNKLKFWNLENQGNFLAKEFDLPNKVHTAAYDFPYLMIGTADSKIAFLNLNNLPNLKIPDSNSMYDIIEMGSKFQCSKILASSMMYAFGCVDGRCCVGSFQDTYQGLRPHPDTGKKMSSKAMKKQSSYSHSPLYGQVNEIDLVPEGDHFYLIVTGTEEIAFFNTLKRDKPRRIRIKGTAGRVSMDGKYFIYAEGNDWCEGINDLKKITKPKIEAVKFTKSQLESFVVKS